MEKYKKKLINLFFVLSLTGLLALLFYQTKVSHNDEVKNKPSFDYTNCFNEDYGIVVLCYHRVLMNTPVTRTVASVSDNSQLHEYNVWIDSFEDQMNFLKKNNIPILTTDQLTEQVSSKSISKKSVVITFDDVDKTVIENAYPITKRLSIPITQFVITGRTGEMINGSKMMGWNDVKNMDQDPLVTSGLHTNDLHYQNNNVPILSTNIDKKTILQDFDKSQEIMMANLNKKGEYFAYPYGAQNSYLDSYMKKNQIKGVFTLVPGVATNSTKSDSIPRLIVTQESWKNIKNWLLD